MKFSISWNICTTIFRFISSWFANLIIIIWGKFAWWWDKAFSLVPVTRQLISHSPRTSQFISMNNGFSHIAKSGAWHVLLLPPRSTSFPLTRRAYVARIMNSLRLMLAFPGMFIERWWRSLRSWKDTTTFLINYLVTRVTKRLCKYSWVKWRSMKR